MHVTGAPTTLLSWRRDVAEEALRLWAEAAARLLRLHGGYLVRAAGGGWVGWWVGWLALDLVLVAACS